MNQKSHGSLTAKYAGVPLQEVAEEDYKAFWTDQSKKRQIRLDIRETDGSGQVIAYAYISQIVYTSHQLVSLLCTNCVITLKGRNLLLLKDALHDEKVRYVQAFHAKKFRTPEKEDTVIETIDIKWLRAEVEPER